MSRYRRRRNPTDCRDWPHCACGQRYEGWRDFDPWPDPPYTNEEVEGLKFDIVFLLSCISRHCPDPTFRRHAITQLLHPIFIGEARQWLN